MRFRWAECQLDREARALERAGKPVRVQPLVLDLLLLLLQHRGRVVSEEFLRRELWHDVQVTEASLRRLVKEARRAIGDDGARQEQIQTIRGRGIRFATPVTTNDGWDTSFVGRADVMEALEQRLEEVAGGLGGLTLLHGPAGVGKTRTLAELEARAAVRGFRVLHGSGRAEAEGDAFHPWLDVAHALGVGDLFRGAPDDAASGSREASNVDARRYAKFRAVSEILGRAARKRPILIALDDLQLADRDGLEALRFLAPTLLRAPVWILGAYRTGGGSRTEEALRVLATLGADTSTQDLALRGLGAAELRSLLRSHLRAEVGEPLAALLADRADGNPLFSLEIARSLQRDGYSLEGDPAPAAEAKLAHGIEPLLARRLSALPESARRLLGAASAIGGEFDAELLREAEACSSEDLAPALDACETAGLIEPRSERKWRFCHPLLAEAMHNQLEAEREGGSAAQHLRIAEALERLGETDPFLLARHFVRSRAVARADRILPYAMAAAREACRRSAFADAEYWYRQATSLADSPDAPPAELCDALLGLGDVLVAGVGVAHARVAFERVARLAVRTGDLRRLALAALGYAHRPAGFGGPEPRVLQWLRAAHAAPCGDRSIEALVSSRLGAELAFAGSAHAAEAEARLQEGVVAARELGDPFTLGRVLGDLSASQFSAIDTRAWIALGEEFAYWGKQAGNHEIEFRGLESRATGLLELGERDELEDAVVECQYFARDHPFRFARTVTGGMVAMLALLDGRLTDARIAIDEAERESGGAVSVGLAAQIATQRYWLAFEEGRFQDMAPALERAWVRFPSLPALLAGSGLAHALSGQADAAGRALRALMDQLPRLAHDRGRLPTLVLAAEISHRVGAPEAAAALEPELRPHAALGAVVATASAYAGSVAQALGWLAAARGDSRRAVEYFQRALRTHEALRSPPWCARSARAIEEMRHLRVVRGGRTR